jgi:tRNA threonylcarbamoyladenosine biosynthesis protein TsaE
MFSTEGLREQMNPALTELVTVSAEETASWGARLAATLGGGEILLLHGALGAGKTVFAGGLAAGLDAPVWRGSPSYALIHEYETTPRLYHADLYRLTGAEAEGLGLEEYATRGSVLVCEWPERAEEYLRGLATSRLVDVWLQHTSANERSLRIREFREDA